MKAATDSAVAAGPDRLLTVGEMYEVDAASARAGRSVGDLMQRAGTAVADFIRFRFSPRPVAVICGPGNNGGDGIVAACRLKRAGWPVSLVLLRGADVYKGATADALAAWDGELKTAEQALRDAELIVDAMFGAGLARAIEGELAELLDRINLHAAPVIAVDMPSGIDGDTGEVRGHAIRAAATVTFVRMKPGHILLPGRLHVGELACRDIGVPHGVLEGVPPSLRLNGPQAWRHALPRAGLADHKYKRGELLVLGGAQMTGAGRMAAAAAARSGIGMLRIAANADSADLYAGDLPSAIVHRLTGRDGEELQPLLEDRHLTCVLMGPGGGLDDEAAGRLDRLLAQRVPCVLDGDALTLLSRLDSWPERLRPLGGRVVLTPHAGEFSRLFPGLKDMPKVQRTQAAASEAGAVIVLKGADTVIAAPDGTTLLNGNAPPSLATAGSGDVLAGIAAGLLAGGMTAFSAASAAVWLHAQAASLAGEGLIASDLPALVPAAIRKAYGARAA